MLVCQILLLVLQIKVCASGMKAVMMGAQTIKLVMPKS
jgi:hypothetical protein